MLVYGKCECFVMLMYACVLCPVEVLKATFCMTCSLLMVEDERCNHMEEAPYDTAYNRDKSRSDNQTQTSMDLRYLP